MLSSFYLLENAISEYERVGKGKYVKFEVGYGGRVVRTVTFGTPPYMLLVRYAKIRRYHKLLT